MNTRLLMPHCVMFNGSSLEIFVDGVDCGSGDSKRRLYSLFNLSVTEYRICLLLKQELAPSKIAILMAMGVSSVSQCRLRMQQKAFDGEGSAKDWDRFVLSL